MAKKSKRIKRFSFRPGFRIGVVDASHDSLLGECFVPVPCYNVIKDPSDPCRGIIGRSGTGKP